MRIFFLLFFSVHLSSISAQSPELSPAELKAFPADISIRTPLPSPCQFPFASIHIIDGRADTSKIGFIKRNLNTRGKKIFSKITVEGGLEKRMQQVLTTHYDSCFSNDSLSLLIVVKRFWADPYPNRKVQLQGVVNRESVFDLYLKFEFFFERNNRYYPLKRIDTLFQTGENEFIPGCADRKMHECELYGYALSRIIEGIDFNYYASRIDRVKNPVSKLTLDSFCTAYNDYPIIKETVLNKGVYLTFDEFRNNRPSVTKYTVEKIKMNNRSKTILYNADNTQPERIPKFWGYCDGTKIYYGNVEHPLFRSGKTFNFFADKKEYDPVYVPLPQAGGSFYGIIVDPIADSFEPLQIDMETGKIF